MILRIAVAVVVAFVLAGSSALAACPVNPSKAQSAKARAAAKNCANSVNLGAVSAISADVVANEPAPTVKPPSYSDPKPAPYEGPTLNLTKPDPGIRPVPTVGYHWSLE